MEDWLRRMDGFRGKNQRLPDATQTERIPEDEIVWDSSSEDEQIKKKKMLAPKRRLFVVKLDFDDCVAGNQRKPKVTRSLFDNSQQLLNKTTTSNSDIEQSTSSRLQGSTSPIIRRRTQNESIESRPKSPVIRKRVKSIERSTSPVFKRKIVRRSKSPVIGKRNRLNRSIKNQIYDSNSNLPINESPKSPVLNRRRRKKLRKKINQDNLDISTVDSQDNSEVIDIIENVETGAYYDDKQNKDKIEIIDNIEDVDTGGYDDKPNNSQIITQLTQDFDPFKSSQSVECSQMSKHIESQSEIQEINSQEDNIINELSFSTDGNLCTTQEKVADVGFIQELSQSPIKSQASSSDDIIQNLKAINRTKDIPRKNSLSWKFERQLISLESERRIWKFEYLSERYNREKYVEFLVYKLKKYRYKNMILAINRQTHEPSYIQLPNKHFCVGKGQLITIFYPWFEMKYKNNSKLYYACNLIHIRNASTEELSNIEEFYKKFRVKQKTIEFTCQCREDPCVKPEECNFNFPSELFLQHLFNNKNKEDENDSYTITNAIDNTIMDNENQTIQNAMNEYTRNNLVRISLVVFCHRIFYYIMSEDVQEPHTSTNEGAIENYKTYKQALCQDLNGDICIIELNKITLIEGSTYRLRLLQFNKRIQISSVPGMHSLLKCIIPNQSKTNIIEFLASNAYAVECIDDFEQSHNTSSNNNPVWIEPKMISLNDLSHSQEHRISIICILLHYEYKKALYVKPVVGDIKNYIKIDIQNLSYIPTEIEITKCFCLFDLNLFQGAFYFDRFSKIIPFEINSFEGVLQQWFTQFPNTFNSNLPNFSTVSNSCKIGDLVTISGKINSIDEETACVWPICQKCNSEFITENDENLECIICKSTGPFINKVILYVNVKLNNNINVNIKLNQDTIKHLLPGVLHSTEGYQIDAVLGANINLEMCIIKQICNNNIIIEELSYSINNHEISYTQ